MGATELEGNFPQGNLRNYDHYVVSYQRAEMRKV